MVLRKFERLLRNHNILCSRLRGDTECGILRTALKCELLYNNYRLTSADARWNRDLRMRVRALLTND